MSRIFRLFLLTVFFSLSWVGHASATFSIVACDKDTGRCGVAVATHNLAVGNGVPFAKAGVGAGVSQFETNPLHRETIFAALGNGETAQIALEKALEIDGEFPDGNDPSFRQIGIVSIGGTAAAFTGHQASAYAGHKAGGYVSVQGNGLASDAVLDAMWNCFHSAEGPLEDRLMTALEAGYAEGGQTIGVTSAALLVSTPEGWPVDVDYRVDFAPGSAITDLRSVFDAGVARQLLFRARRAARDGALDRAEEYTVEALVRPPDWDRIWLNAAWLAEETGNREVANVRFCRFQALNPVWADMLSDEIEFSHCD
ncbi:MAG: DUF1028 domain-containing protein [Pseudomonadota bacterium]